MVGHTNKCVWYSSGLSLSQTEVLVGESSRSHVVDWTAISLALGAAHAAATREIKWKAAESGSSGRGSTGPMADLTKYSSFFVSNSSAHYLHHEHSNRGQHE